MFCEKCGNQINDDASFCPHCGFTMGSSEGINLNNSGSMPVSSQFNARTIAIIASLITR